MTLQNKFLNDYRKMFRLVNSGETFVAFDTETTGLSSDNCRIIEIGAVKFDKTGVLNTYSTLINPQQIIPVEITQLTNINNEMVKNSPVIKEILPGFLDFIKETTLIGHNIQFDMRFLQAECERNGFLSPKNAVIDTLRFSRWALPELGKYKQTFLAEHFGINLEAAHRAYDDARVCGNIFLQCIKVSADRQRL